ncbi:MAG: maleylpyruvate isomerase family mycothiol-dependent enzyme [Actinobacteria bacterium]|uniref:Unannotated protein n=1 Tax=freshwater metagenome TaxID=449393 RepID=A0A6J6X6F6_9ZZZZ|nr:maleylpyruvate isomerase family mycothiol-dependent enzyme [Actinomycetota bacterium]
MQLSPHYDFPIIVSIDGSPSDQCVPLVRQRRRLEDLLRGLSDEQWNAPSRCGTWTIKDVVVHLAGVNRFWQASAAAGIAGTPTRLLGGFDPAATPSMMVDSLGSITSAAALEMFVSSNDALLATVADLDDTAWTVVAESPMGHVSLRLVMQHALWDSWVHERDIMLPLGLTPAVEADEVRSCLQYAAALGAALSIGLGQPITGWLSVQAANPSVIFAIEVTNLVAISELADGVVSVTASCLQGDAVQLAEALSIRVPLASSAPHEWHALLGRLATAFDTPSEAG